MKFLRIEGKLKSTTRILLFSIFTCLTSFANAQINKVVSLQADSALLETVLKDIEKQSNVHFAYDPSFIKNIRVSLHIKNLPVDKVLSNLLNQTAVCYKESDQNHYLLFACTQNKWQLNGTVQDFETGEVLPFASIAIRAKDVGTTANKEGQFSFFDLTEDSVKLDINYIGYYPIEVTVSSEALNSEFFLFKKSSILNDVQIDIYTEFVNGGGHFGQLTINTDLLNGFPSLGEPDPIKSIKLLPGVGGNAETSTGIAMRGGKFDQTMILFDDFQIFHADHFFGLFSTINQNMVKDVQVYRSGYSAKYSGFTSGLVQITGKDGNMKKVAGGVSTNIYSSNVHVEIPIIKNKWSTALSFRKDNAGLNQEFWKDAIVLPHIENEIRVKSPSAANAEDTEGQINFHDASIKTKIKLSDKQSFTFSYFNSKDRLETTYNNALDFEEELISILELSSAWTNNGFSAKWNHKIGENYTGKLIYTYSKFNTQTDYHNVLEVFEDDTLESFQDLALTNSITQQHYRYDAELKKSKSTWYFGADITLFQSQFITVDVEEEFKDNFNKLLPAVYAENRRSITDKLDVFFGSRLTLENEENSIYFEPRVSAFYSFNKKLRSTFSYGLYYQHAKQYVPDQREGLVPDYWLLPDYELSFPTRAHLTSLGITFKQKKWLINSEVFYKDISNMSEQFPSVSDLIESNSDFVKALSSGSSKVIGGDIVASRRFKKSNIWVGVGINNVRNGSDSVTVQNYQPYYTNLADIKLGYLYNWGKWEAGIIWTWLGGRKYTEITDEINSIGEIEVSNQNLPDYHRMDVSMSYKIKLKTVHGAIRANVFNVYNRSNLRTVNFTQLDSSPTAIPTAIPVSTLGIRPNLTLEVNF